MTYLWSVFTKPWAGLPGDELGRLVAGLGFAGAEIPVRDTAYVTPATAEAELPKFVEQFGPRASSRSASPAISRSRCSRPAPRPASR